MSEAEPYTANAGRKYGGEVKSGRMKSPATRHEPRDDRHPDDRPEQIIENDFAPKSFHSAGQCALPRAGPVAFLPSGGAVIIPNSRSLRKQASRQRENRIAGHGGVFRQPG